MKTLKKTLKAVVPTGGIGLMKVLVLSMFLVSLLSFNSYADSGNDLIEAAEKGDTVHVNTLLNKGVDVNTKDNNYGATALMWASEKGHNEVVKVLSEVKANNKKEWRKTIFEVRFWITSILLLSVIVLLSTYPKMRGKSFLLSFISFSLVTQVAFYSERYLLLNGILDTQFQEHYIIVFYLTSVAATACLLGYVINIGYSETINSVLAKPGGFAIYENALNDERVFQAVKNGFSWPAFFFGPIWAWTNGMVGVGFALLFLGIFLSILGNVIIISMGVGGVFIDMLITIGAVIWVGLSGNIWKKSSLEKRGYKLVQGSVSASSPSEAIQLYNEKKG